MGELSVRRNRTISAPRFQGTGKTEKQSGPAKVQAGPNRAAATVSETLRRLSERVNQVERHIREGRRTLRSGEAALAEVKAKLEAEVKAERKAAIAGDSDLAVFQMLFGQAQEIANKLHGLLLKARGREDGSQAAGMQKALAKLSELIGKAAEV